MPGCYWKEIMTNKIQYGSGTWFFFFTVITRSFELIREGWYIDIICNDLLFWIFLRTNSRSTAMSKTSHVQVIIYSSCWHTFTKRIYHSMSVPLIIYILSYLFFKWQNTKTHIKLHSSIFNSIYECVKRLDSSSAAGHAGNFASSNNFIGNKVCNNIMA